MKQSIPDEMLLDDKDLEALEDHSPLSPEEKFFLDLDETQVLID